jgi:hypothetical protein
MLRREGRTRERCPPVLSCLLRADTDFRSGGFYLQKMRNWEAEFTITPRISRIVFPSPQLMPPGGVMRRLSPPADPIAAPEFGNV